MTTMKNNGKSFQEKMSQIIQEAEVTRQIDVTKSSHGPSLKNYLTSFDNLTSAYFIIIIIGCVVFGLAYLISSSTLNSSQDVPKEWFEGGLQKEKTLADWNKASQREKLATAAVSVKVYIRYNSRKGFEDKLREAAEKMVICMNEEAKSSDTNRTIGSLLDFCIYRVDL